MHPIRTAPTPTAPVTADTAATPAVGPRGDVRDHRAAHAHPAGRGTAAVVTVLPAPQRDPRHDEVATTARLATVTALVAPAAAGRTGPEDGSLVAEYGLLAVVAATVAGVLITWASSGALTGFFDALLSTARGLVGA